MRNAKELCAMLLKKSLKELSEEEEEIVVDYLEDIGIEVELDTKPIDLCNTLLEKTMLKEKGKKIPMSPYINEILDKSKIETEQKEKLKMKRELERKRLKAQKILTEQSKKLPGCVTENILPTGLYNLVIDPKIGIIKLKDETEQYSAVVSVSDNLYNTIFFSVENPVLEIITHKGDKTYARIGEPHKGNDKLVLISPLVSTFLNFNKETKAYLKLCKTLPEISKIDFTYYGTKLELDNDLLLLLEKLPSVINAFSYLSLGLILLVDVNEREVQIRVDKLFDENDKPIFVGLIPFGERDIPFDIISDN